MKNLILIRHAKSDWATGVDDHDRPLADRGIGDADIVSKAAMQLIGGAPVIWSSSARRALSTARIFAANWGLDDSSINVDESFYTFDEGALEKAVGKVPDSIDRVFIFGHNEAITDFVNKFGNIYIDNVPTSGLVELNLPTDSWRKIVRGTTGTVLFPKDLKHGQHDL